MKWGGGCEEVMIKTILVVCVFMYVIEIWIKCLNILFTKHTRKIFIRKRFVVHDSSTEASHSLLHRINTEWQ